MLASARQRPFKLHAFPKFVQLCKVAISEGDAAQGAKVQGQGAERGSPLGLALELGTTLRFATFVARLADLASLALRRLSSCAAAADLEGLQAELLRLASETVTWAEKNSFSEADAARVVLACLRSVSLLLRLQPRHPVFSRPLPSLQLQGELLQALPRLAKFALQGTDASVLAANEIRQLVLRMSVAAVSELDETLVFPRLHDLLRPFWPESDTLKDATEVAAVSGAQSGEHLEVLVAAARRFGGAGELRQKMWLLLESSPPPGWLVATLAEPIGCRCLADVIRLLDLWPELCARAVDQPAASALHRLLFLSLAARVAAQYSDTNESMHADPAMKAVVSAFAAEARSALRWEPPRQPDASTWLSGGPAGVLAAVLETLRASPACVQQLEVDGDELLTRLLRAVGGSDGSSGSPAMGGRPAPLLWQLTLRALDVFLASSTASLTSKVRRLHVALTGTRRRLPAYVEAALWVSMGQALFLRLEQLSVAGSTAGADEAKAMLQLIALATKALGSGATPPHMSVLVAISYLLPLVVTVSYMLPGLCEHGGTARMPHLSQVFIENSPMCSAHVLTGLNSPARSVPNPIRVRPVFGKVISNLPATTGAVSSSSPGAAAGGPNVGGSGKRRATAMVPLPSICPFCDRAPVQDCQLLKTSTCAGCGLELLSVDWAIFQPQSQGESPVLCLPRAWGNLRRQGIDAASADCCWLKNSGELLDVAMKLGAILLDSSMIRPSGGQVSRGQVDHAPALQLLEPTETQQDSPDTSPASHVQRGGALAPAEGAAQAARHQQWLLGCGVLGTCSAAPCEVLRERSSSLASLFARLLRPSGSQHSTLAVNADWEAGSAPSGLISLIQSSSFVATLIGSRDQAKAEVMAATPPAKKARVPLMQVSAKGERELQAKCHNWRLEVLAAAFAGPETTKTSTSAVASTGDQQAAIRIRRIASLPPPLLRAVFTSAPVDAMSIVVPSLVLGSSDTLAEKSVQRSCIQSLQRLFSFSMLAPICVDDLFRTFDRNMYLRLLERYSQRNVRVASLCHLLLRGSLKARVKHLLPKLLPSVVLGRNMTAIQDICVLLEAEAVESLFTPQLPHILSAIAEQSDDRVAAAFMFILQQVYNNKLTINNICDASLGKVLVLILWSSARLPGEESYSRALSAINNIAVALRAPRQGGTGAPGQGATPRAPDLATRKRNGPEGGVVGAGPPSKKQKPGIGGTVIDVGDDMSTAVPSDVVQTLEGSFLHVLDILEIVLAGNRQSPKWAEYSPLLNDPLDMEFGRGCGKEALLDHGRLLKTIARLLQMLPDSLHRFAPKLLEFLQNVTVLSGYHPESIPCWKHFVKAVGVHKLKPLIPAVVSELLRLAGHVKESPSPQMFGELVQNLLVGLVMDTCRQHPDLVASLPFLPSWEQLKGARSAMDQVLNHQNAPNGFAHRLSYLVSQLEDATQQAVRRALLESIEALVSSQRQQRPTAVAELSNCTLARIMRALLKFLWESSAWSGDQLQCGRLLGSLGAIDPCRFAGLDLGQGHGHNNRRAQGVPNMDLLAKRVLVEFLAPNLTSKNSYAFAAQEILKCLQPGGRADRLLASLEREDVRETLRPYLNSSYQLVEPAAAVRLLQSGQGGTPTFEGALAQAAALLPTERGSFFEACLPAVPGNHALALFLMHHVLHDLITSSSSSSAGGQEKGLKVLANTLASLLEADAGAKHDGPSSTSRQAATAQAVFSLVDDLVQRREEINNSSTAEKDRKAGDEIHRNRHMQCIEILRAPITNRKVVSAAVRCGAFARALQFLEDDIIEKAGLNLFDMDGTRISEEDCSLLQSIYRELGEPDGVLGALRIGPSTVRTRIPELELAGRWSDVQACYEEQLSSSSATSRPERNNLLCGLVRCTQNMRRFENSLHLIQGMHVEDGMSAQLRPYAVEAAWQLGSWDRLSQALETPSGPSEGADFQFQLGSALLALHHQDKERLGSVLQEATLQTTRAVASAARESYTRAYQHLLRLHLLSDISWLSECPRGGVGGAAQAAANRQSPAPGRPGQLATILLARSEVTAATFSARQLLLSPLRVALEDMQLKDDAKLMELAFVRLCRKNNEPVALEHPNSSFHGVSGQLMARAQLEWGRLLYARGSRHDALQHLQQLAPKVPKARLLGTRWATEAASELLIPRVAEADFKDAKDRLQDYEAAWFYHASYLDQLLKGQIAEEQSKVSGAGAHSSLAAPVPPAKGVGPAAARGRGGGGAPPAAAFVEPPRCCPFDLRNLVVFTIRGYLQALQRGTKRLHFILNRVLQLVWDCCEIDLHKKDTMEEIQNQARHMRPWMWYVVLPQLLSRVHNSDMTEVFSGIIRQVLAAYPQQAGWQFLQLLKSANENHNKLGKQMMLEVGRAQGEVHRLLSTRMQLAGDLIALATFSPPDGQQVCLAKSFPRLAGSGSGRMERWQALVPLQSQVTANIPRMRSQDIKAAQAQSFFPEQILSERCLDNVEVFRTKEKPKKLTFLGNDGRHYPFLCKAERRGDLRKDSRLMEFSVMVNQLLALNPDARRRNLEVRTFNVVILSEKCGLLEWVPNTRGMRHIIDDIWKSRKSTRQQTVREVKELFDSSKDLYETFSKQVLPRHPPVLHKWFAQSGDPSVWLSKRILFSRSQALWCMLGYIVGLGDRHGENILMDTESGRCVHVDFDCLFGKGMMLERPEMVPFRLTQNCVAAMGITGVEGVFRSSCELVMEVLRDRANTQTLLSVLHVFVADPLIEITQRRPDLPQSGPEKLDEHRVQQARTTIAEVEKKLNGMLNCGAVIQPRSGVQDTGESVLSKDERARGLLGRDRGVGLSVKGQVDELLAAAMCKRNLSEMYVGWQPWL
ncbi:unnamed protein product [Polarella glacialis]|uniref:Serine/threonine-protein kinase ATR n=1 Tax=Polarella glacialis TaxID=89957 RepID=A0A813JWL7_POLGL|nr:unnamed protein product [Polarella glacialis]